MRTNRALLQCKGRIWPSRTFHKSEKREINCHIFRQAKHVTNMIRTKNSVQMNLAEKQILTEMKLFDVSLRKSIYTTFTWKSPVSKDISGQDCFWPHAK